MECYGFARSGVASEYSPTAYAISLATDVSTSLATFTTLLSFQVYVDNPNESLWITGNGTSVCTTGGHTPQFRIAVDGRAARVARKTVGNANGKTNVSLSAVVSGLGKGYHTVSWDWRSNGAGITIFINAASQPSIYSADLICERGQALSDLEQSGFAKSGWPVQYTTGPSEVVLASSVSNTGTSPTTALISGTFRSFAPTSALLVRFSACGTSNSTGRNIQSSARFNIIIDGVSIGGTAGYGDDIGFRFNAAMVMCWPVQAGYHQVLVNWCGGSSGGSAIDPTTAIDHASFSVEEVFCIDPDVGNLYSDMGGFPVQSYNAFHLPRVYFDKLSQDISSGGNTAAATVNINVASEHALLICHGTITNASIANDSYFYHLAVDGVNVNSASRGVLTFSQIDSCGLAYGVTVGPGPHTVQLIANGGGINPVSDPTAEHAALLVREYWTS